MAGEVDAVRAFNRFHTRLVGALDEHLLKSDYALPQVRVLYEIAHAPRERAPSASDIAQLLRLDAGYMSRLVAGLEADGLVERRASPDNARRMALRLSERGRELFATMEQDSAREVARMLEPLTPAQRRALVGSMRRIRQLLGDTPDDATLLLREPEPGDLGLVVSRQARLYAEEYGWNRDYEALVAEIVAGFVRDFDPARERCWIAERDGEVVGSVFVVRQDDAVARLRLLYVDPMARGLGLGRRLVDECIRFARGRGYRRLVLWTNDCLVSARRIYQAAGFRLTGEEPHHSFGKDLVGQTWELDL
jgi:DNA-binding MarR family transcriptional regulator/GNAT superfamily N-acetyltransferase